MEFKLSPLAVLIYILELGQSAHGTEAEKQSAAAKKQSAASKEQCAAEEKHNHSLVRSGAERSTEKQGKTSNHAKEAGKQQEAGKQKDRACSPQRLRKMHASCTQVARMDHAACRCTQVTRSHALTSARTMYAPEPNLNTPPKSGAGRKLC